MALNSSDEDVKDYNESLEIYKYRRRKDRDEISKSTSQFYSRKDSTAPPRKSNNIKVDEEPSKHTYTMLQEVKSEFGYSSRLRHIFLIFSSNGWKLVVLVVLVIGYVINTSLYTFCQPNDRPFWIISCVIGIKSMFAIDVAFVYCLKFSKKWRKTLNIMEPELSRVVIDGILALPYAMLFFITNGINTFDYHAIVPIMSMFCQYRVLEYFYTRSSQAGRNQWSTFLLQYLILFVLAVHTSTCVWFLFLYRGFDIHKIRTSWSMSVAGSCLPSQTMFDWYYVCAYWSVMILSTNTLGDLYPMTTSERIAAIIINLLGYFLTTIVFVGSMTSQFITITTRRSVYVSQLKKIQNHLHLIKMDPEVTNRILRYYEDLWYQKSGVFKPKLLKLLPFPLQMEICYDLNAVPLYSSLIFRQLPEPFLRRLSLAMTHQFYLPGDVIYNHNQQKSIMVCVTSGVIEFLSDEDDESPMISFSRGTCFGEISLVYNIPARCTVKAATYVECQVLHKIDFIKLMITYPDLVSKIRDEIQQRINRSRIRRSIQDAQEQFELNIYASKLRKKSSIKCLKDKLRYIQGIIHVDPLTKEDYLDEKCLDLYVLSEHIKKRETQFTCLSSKFPWILEYNCPLVKYWQTYMLFLVIYICIVYPYLIAYKKEFPPGFSYYTEIAIVISLIINLMLTCITAIKTKKTYIITVRKIINYRLNTLGFYLDILAIIPFEYLITIHTISGYHDDYRMNLFFMLKGIKLCLVWRLSSFFEELEKKLLLNTIAVKVSKYCIYIFLLCYWCGVILFMEACFVRRCTENSWFGKLLVWEYREIGDSNSRTEYPHITASYFAATLLLSVGYGDVSPGDEYDMVLVAFISVYGILLTGYCIAEFSAVTTHWSRLLNPFVFDAVPSIRWKYTLKGFVPNSKPSVFHRTKTAFLEVIITIDKFMNENNMHKAIKARIMAFYELQWQYNSGVELTGESWLDKTVVPAELRKKVLHQARFKALTSIKFFQVKNKAFIHTITESARDVILPPGEIVYYGGTVSRELYIIESGYCLITSKSLRESNKERVVGPGNHLGLLVLLFGVPAVSTVITLTHCKLITIGHSAYSSTLSLYPDMREHDGLLTRDELMTIEKLSKDEYMDKKAFYTRFETTKPKIQNILQKFLDNSFIDVRQSYQKKKQKYRESYNQFKIMSSIAPYLLMPYTIKPDGIFINVWSIIRVGVAFVICLTIPTLVALLPKQFNFFILALDIICYIDLYVRLHVAYYGPQNQLIYHPYMTAANYLKVPTLISQKDLKNDITISIPKYIFFIYLQNTHNSLSGWAETILHRVMTADIADSLSAFKLVSRRHHFHRRAFLLDLLTCFPWYGFYQLYELNHGITSDDMSQHINHCGFRLIGVLQIYKLYPAFFADSINTLKRAYIMCVFQFLLVTVFFLNLYSSILLILTCRLIYAKDNEDFMIIQSKLTLQGPYRFTVYKPEGNMICQLGSWIDEAKIVQGSSLTPTKVYLLALYWTAATFSGAGFGDITPQSTGHMILSIVVIFHGALFFGYVYSRVASQKAMADQVITNYQEKIKHLEMFMKREKTPIALKRTVIDYWKYQWKRTGGWSHQSILGKLHTNLNEDAVLYMYENTLKEIPLFEGVESSFFRAFAKKLIELYFQKGYTVIRANEVISMMYIIYRGKVDIISRHNEAEACMGPGGIFGNIRGIAKYQTMSNVVASRNIDLLAIEGPEFYILLKSYPSVLKKVKNSVSSTRRDYVIPTMSSEKSSTEVSAEFRESDNEEKKDVDLFSIKYYTSTQGSQGHNVDEISHCSRSINSYGNVDYISAWSLWLRPDRWFRSSVVPDSPAMKFIDYFMLAIAYTDFLMLVYQMIFQSNIYFFNICVTYDLIFMYKLFLDLHTAYINRYGDYVFDTKKVRKMFFSNVILRRRDVLANMPISYLAFALDVSPEMQMFSFSFLRTPQLFRITYLFTYHRTNRKYEIGSANLFFKLTYIALWASIMAHVFACLFFKLSCLTPVHCTSENWMTKSEMNLRADYSEKNYFAIYITSLWYMINLFTITGTGDITAQNEFEVIETILIVVVIKFCAGLLISEMSAMITAHSSSRIEYDYGIHELKDGLRDTDLSYHQMNKMWDYVRELWNRQQGRQMPELVYELPFVLRCEVMQAVYGTHINESVIFSKTTEDFRRMLVMWMRHCVFFTGNYIVQCGDADQCIYFIHRGEVEVLTVHQNLTESVYDILGPEDSFGIAQGLFVGVSHHFSFRARTVVDIVYLKLENWKYLLDFYPKSAKMVQRKVSNVYLAT